MKTLTDRQIKLIVNNIVKVIKTGNSSLLSKQAYNYLYPASGFIAHYNIYGFQNVYKNTELLRQDILNNQCFNQWGQLLTSRLIY
jgi:ribonuclease HIII